MTTLQRDGVEGKGDDAVIMEVVVVSPSFRFRNVTVPHESTVRDLVGLFNRGEVSLIRLIFFGNKRATRVFGLWVLANSSQLTHYSCLYPSYTIGTESFHS